MDWIILIIAIIWLTVSNIYLTYSLVKLKILDKSKDLYEFKKAIEKTPKQEPVSVPSEIPIYN